MISNSIALQAQSGRHSVLDQDVRLRLYLVLERYRQTSTSRQDADFIHRFGRSNAIIHHDRDQAVDSIVSISSSRVEYEADWLGPSTNRSWSSETYRPNLSLTRSWTALSRLSMHGDKHPSPIGWLWENDSSRPLKSSVRRLPTVSPSRWVDRALKVWWRSMER